MHTLHPVCEFVFSWLFSNEVYSWLFFQFFFKMQCHSRVDIHMLDLFAQLPSKVLLEVFLDTCHSGTGLKAVYMLFDRRPRYLPPPSWEAFKQVDGRSS
jgi:hypothetical protein